jgi:hypothetical protein
MKELVSVTGAATKLYIETEHKKKLKLKKPQFSKHCVQKSQNIEQCPNYWSISL